MVVEQMLFLQNQSSSTETIHHLLVSNPVFKVTAEPDVFSKSFQEPYTRDNQSQGLKTGQDVSHRKNLAKRSIAQELSTWQLLRTTLNREQSGIVLDIPEIKLYRIVPAAWLGMSSDRIGKVD
jgi:hypothetical protein